MDATMEALRLVSEGCDDRVEHLGIGTSATRGENGQLIQCLRSTSLPSREVLLTLLWGLRVEGQRLERRSKAPLGSVRGIPSSEQPSRKYVLKVTKTSAGGSGVGDGMNKRYRLA